MRIIICLNFRFTELRFSLIFIFIIIILSLPNRHLSLFSFYRKSSYQIFIFYIFYLSESSTDKVIKILFLPLLIKKIKYRYLLAWYIDVPNIDIFISKLEIGGLVTWFSVEWNLLKIKLGEYSCGSKFLQIINSNHDRNFQSGIHYHDNGSQNLNNKMKDRCQRMSRALV